MKERDIQLAYNQGLEEGKAHRGKRLGKGYITSLARKQGYQDNSQEFNSFIDGFLEGKCEQEGEN